MWCSQYAVTMKDGMLKVLVFLQFHIPDLRVGTLDSLLALSDDLTKVRERNLVLIILLL